MNLPDNCLSKNNPNNIGKCILEINNPVIGEEPVEPFMNNIDIF